MSAPKGQRMSPETEFKKGERSSPETEFKKGHKPYNKGIKRGSISPQTEFKKGVCGEDHISWRGGVQMNANDCAYLNTGANLRVRRPRHIYEENFGPIPKGFIIIHKDSDKHNDEPSNLEAISRAELMKRNNPKLN